MTGQQLLQQASKPTFSTGIGIVHLVLSGFGMLIGIASLIVVLLGVFRIIMIARHAITGTHKVPVGHFLPDKWMGSMPSALAALLETLAAFVLALVVFSGAWASLVNALTGTTAHIVNHTTTLLQQHTGG